MGECLVWLKREYNVLIRSVIVLRAPVEANRVMFRISEGLLI